MPRLRRTALGRSADGRSKVRRTSDGRCRKIRAGHYRLARLRRQPQYSERQTAGGRAMAAAGLAATIIMGSVVIWRGSGFGLGVAGHAGHHCRIIRRKRLRDFHGNAGSLCWHDHRGLGETRMQRQQHGQHEPQPLQTRPGNEAVHPPSIGTCSCGCQKRITAPASSGARSMALLGCAMEFVVTILPARPAAAPPARLARRCRARPCTPAARNPPPCTA